MTAEVQIEISLRKFDNDQAWGAGGEQAISRDPGVTL